MEFQYTQISTVYQIFLDLTWKPQQSDSCIIQYLHSSEFYCESSTSSVAGTYWPAFSWALLRTPEWSELDLNVDRNSEVRRRGSTAANFCDTATLLIAQSAVTWNNVNQIQDNIDYWAWSEELCLSGWCLTERTRAPRSSGGRAPPWAPAAAWGWSSDRRGRRPEKRPGASCPVPRPPQYNRWQRDKMTLQRKLEGGSNRNLHWKAIEVSRRHGKPSLCLLYLIDTSI